MESTAAGELERLRAMDALESNAPARTSSVPWKMYFSRTLTAWGDRMWTFGGGIFMTKLGDADTSLRLVAIYGLVQSLSAIVFGASIGNWIDDSKRLRAAKICLLVQNFSLIVCCAVLAAYFWNIEWLLDNWGDWTTTAVAAAVIVIAGVANLASVGSKIMLEKDWIVVVAGDDHNLLAKMNSVFRTIDLLTLLIAPLICGLIFDFINDQVTAIFIACWNAVSVILEYSLLVAIYNQYPRLAEKRVPAEAEAAHMGQIKDAVRSWKIYFTHPVRNAGLGLACLYMTVLGFDNITYGYCLEQCITESVLGGLVGVSGLVGVAGSLTYPILRKKLNVSHSGAIGMLLLVLALVPCVVSVWLPGSPFMQFDSDEDNNGTLWTTESSEGDGDCYVESYASVGSLLLGIILARYGLWVSDLSITQILQEGVDESRRGAVGGVQGALNSALDTVKFALVILLPSSATFGWLILASFATVCVGAVLYMSYAVKNWTLDLATSHHSLTELPLQPELETKDAKVDS